MRPERWVPRMALRRVTRFLEVPCASAKRSRLLLEVFDDCSTVSRRPPRAKGIIREVNETVFVLNFLKKGSSLKKMTASCAFIVSKVIENQNPRQRRRHHFVTCGVKKPECLEHQICIDLEHSVALGLERQRLLLPALRDIKCEYGDIDAVPRFSYSGLLEEWMATRCENTTHKITRN